MRGAGASCQGREEPVPTQSSTLPKRSERSREEEEEAEEDEGFIQQL